MRQPGFLDGLVALFAGYMFVRYLTGARALLRAFLRREPIPGPGAVVAAVNFVLAVVILAFAVKVFVSGLISR